jgi:hypothetical protein
MSLRAASRAVSQALCCFERRLDRKEIYYTVWFNAKFLKALHCLSRGKPRGIKPDSRIRTLEGGCPNGVNYERKKGGSQGIQAPLPEGNKKNGPCLTNLHGSPDAAGNPLSGSWVTRRFGMS